MENALNAPTAAEQLALDGGVGVVRTFIKPIAQYPGLPSEAQLGAQLIAERDVRYSEAWMWGAIMMRSITAAFADDQIGPGPVLAWGGSKNGAAPLMASIHDQRITGVQPDVAGVVYAPIRGHQPSAVRATGIQADHHLTSLGEVNAGVPQLGRAGVAIEGSDHLAFRVADRNPHEGGLAALRGFAI